MNYQAGFINLKQTINIEESIKPGNIMLIPKSNIGIIEGEFYYVKRKGINCYNELLASEIAKQIGIKAATYDIACFNNDVYLISKLEDERTYKVSNILKEYYHTSNISNYNNIMDINNAICGLFKKRDTLGIKNELVNIFLFDVLVANPERNLTNLKVIDNGISIHFAPIYSDEKRLLNEETIFDLEYNLGVKRADLLINDLYSFLKENKNLISNLEEKLEILNPNNIRDMFERIEMHTKGIIPNSLKDKYISGFGYNAGAIYSCILKLKEEQVNQKKLKKVI